MSFATSAGMGRSRAYVTSHRTEWRGRPKKVKKNLQSSFRGGFDTSKRDSDNGKFQKDVTRDKIKM